MAKTTKAKVKAAAPAPSEPLEERIRMAAYFDWLNQTGGNPVDEETSRQFWLNAEQQAQDGMPSSVNGR